jgi:hypothetical protein
MLHQHPLADHVPLGVEVAATLLVGGDVRLSPREMSQRISLSIVYEPVESGWVQARIEGIPEVITAGPSKAEARMLVLDALREYLLSIRGNGDEFDRESVEFIVPS